jgi:hypothetical protein
LRDIKDDELSYKDDTEIKKIKVSQLLLSHDLQITDESTFDMDGLTDFNNIKHDWKGNTLTYSIFSDFKRTKEK